MDFEAVELSGWQGRNHWSRNALAVSPKSDALESRHQMGAWHKSEDDYGEGGAAGSLKRAAQLEQARFCREGSQTVRRWIHPDFQVQSRRARSVR